MRQLLVVAALLNSASVAARLAWTEQVLGPDGATARVFLASRHRFSAAPGAGRRLMMRDAATGSSWDAFGGTALAGRLVGSQLAQVTPHVSYWFSWHSFFPDSAILGAAAP